jgi:hypothetical protein
MNARGGQARTDKRQRLAHCGFANKLGARVAFQESSLRCARECGSASDAEEMVEKWAGALRSELSGVPARVTRDVTMRRTIEREINDALTLVTEIAAQPED